MSAAPIIREVYREHIEYFGEPTDSIVFSGGQQSNKIPERIDIFVWDPESEDGVTTFSTIGMAILPQPESGRRTELHFSVRRLLSQKEKHAVALFLANLAMYPFASDEPLDWWHTIQSPGEIPLFNKAQCVLLHPRFIKDGWDTIDTEEGEIRLLNVIPITEEERRRGKITAILDSLDGIDLFEPR